MYAIQHRCMSLKIDVSWTKLIYVIFEFVLLRITIIYLTKHRCIHVRNKNPHTQCSGGVGGGEVVSISSGLSHSTFTNLRSLLLVPFS